MIKSKFIKSLGFEIECVFKKTDKEAVEKLCRINNWELSSDPSIHNNRTYNSSAEIKFKYNIENLENIIPEIKKLFTLVKSGKKFNAGGHIHVCLNNRSDYFKLASWDFADFFQQQYKLFAKTDEEKSRINCSWCKDYLSKQDFIQQTNRQLCERDGYKSNRYFAINYNSFPAKGYETIEFRIFCLTGRYTQLTKNINFLIKTINSFLKKSEDLDFEIKLNPQNKQDKIKINKKIGFSEIENSGEQ